MACRSLGSWLGIAQRLSMSTLLHRPIPAVTVQCSRYVHVGMKRCVSGNNGMSPCVTHSKIREVRLMSTDSNTSSGGGDEAEAIQYLSSVGIDCRYMDRTNPAVLTNTQNEAITLVTYFEDYGFTRQEVAIILGRHPALLNTDIDEIKRRFEVFESVGLNPENIVQTITISKSLMTTKLDIIEGHIQNMKILMGASLPWINSMLKYKPVVFTLPDPNETGANIMMIKDLLSEHGSAYPEKVLRQIMRNDYRLYKISEEQIMSTVDYLGSKGIYGTNLVYVVKKCPNIFQITPKDLERRLKTLGSRLSLNESELKKFVLYFPRALGMNEKNLNHHLDFVFSIGLTSADVVKHPYLLWMSIGTLENRYEEQKKAGLFETPEKRKNAIPRLFLSEKMFRYQMDRILVEQMHEKNKKKTISQIKEQ